MINFTKRKRPPEKLAKQNSNKSLLHNKKIAENQKVVELILEDFEFILTTNCYSASDRRRRKIQKLQWKQNKTKHLIATNTPFEQKKTPKTYNSKIVKPSNFSNGSSARKLQQLNLKSKLIYTTLGKESKQKIRTSKKEELKKINTKHVCSKNHKLPNNFQVKTETSLLPLQLECAIYAFSQIFQQYNLKIALELWTKFVFLTREEEKRIRLKSIDAVSQSFIRSVWCRSFDSVVKNKECTAKQSKAYARRNLLMKCVVIQSAWRRYCHSELMLRQELLEYLTVLLDPFKKDNRELVFHLSESDERFIDLCCLICKAKRGRLSSTTPSKSELLISIKGIRQIILNNDIQKGNYESDDIIPIRKIRTFVDGSENLKPSKKETDANDSTKFMHNDEPKYTTSPSGDNIEESDLNYNIDGEGRKGKTNEKSDEGSNLSVDLHDLDNMDDSYSEFSEEELEKEIQDIGIDIEHETSRYQNGTVQLTDTIHSDFTCLNERNDIIHEPKIERTQQYAMIFVNAILLKVSEYGIERKERTMTGGIKNGTIHKQDDKIESSDEMKRCLTKKRSHSLVSVNKHIECEPLKDQALSCSGRSAKESAIIFYLDVHDIVVKSMRERASVKIRQTFVEKFVHNFFQEVVNDLK